MPDFIDRFVGSGALSAHTADSSATWIGAAAADYTLSSGSTYPTSGANALLNGAIPYSTYVPASANYSASIVVGADFISGASGGTAIGIPIRITGTDGSLSYYLGYIIGANPGSLAGTPTLQFYRIDAGNSGTTIGLATPFLAPAATNDTYTVQVSGVGATVTLTFFQNGNQVYQTTDTSGSRIVVAGTIGLFAGASATPQHDIFRTLWAGATTGPPALTIAPPTPLVTWLGTQSFTVSPAETGETFGWVVTGSPAGTISGALATEVYTAPASGSANTLTVTSVDLPTRTVAAAIALTSGTLSSVTLTGPAPSSGFAANESAAFTATLNAVTGGGGQVITLASTGLSDVFHGVTGGGTVTTVTVPSGQTAHTFFLVPSNAGPRSVSITSAGLTVSGSPINYTANAQTLAVSPTTLMTSSTTVVTFTGGGTHYTVSAPTFTPTGVAGVTAGSVTVVNDTTATVSVTTGVAVGTITWTDSTTSATATQAVSTAPVISTTTVLSVVQGFASGLNTVGYAVYNPDGTLYSAFTTAGVNERGTGSGNYGAVVTIPSPGTAEIRWSIGGVAPFAVDVETTAQMAVIAPNGWDEITLESGINARQGMALALDAMCSLLSGATAAASTILVKDPTGAHARISANVDKFGNRSSVTLTPPA